MPEQLSREEVEAWDLHRDVERTLVGVLLDRTNLREQSKLWISFWVTVVSLLTAVLAVTHAASLAYAVPLGVLFVVANARNSEQGRRGDTKRTRSRRRDGSSAH